ncbi:ankyrin [Cucurbitaria berberidis CBS 394.84]|uniref:Ankyrin n=1 Tax=Cucurbitaria berberidis CBS 394.84 TaxID=1168544 RepID=A0A9P4G8L1_9PLEO|nr:ankyrin [Cucurbitaria berberidis CBS 394.84]KAF1841020.1 ankyrin [Cucurbitaria berberidis CBS 394.84]
MLRAGLLYTWHAKTGALNVDFLLSNGASVNETATEAQWTPLHCVTCGSAPPRCEDVNPRLEIAKVLLNYGAYLQATVLDGRIALHCAAQNGYVEIVRSLIEQGADVCAATTGGEKILHSICSIGNCPQIPERISTPEMLLDRGANVDAGNETGQHHCILGLMAGSANLFTLLVQ